MEREAQRLLDAGVRGRVFPGASAAVGWFEGDTVVTAEAQAGRLMPEGPSVSAKTLYDWSFMSQAVTHSLALRLAALGKLNLALTNGDLVPELRLTEVGDRSLEDLLFRRGILAPEGALYLDLPHEPGTGSAKRWMVLEATRRVGRDASPSMYGSSLQYLVAGELMAQQTGSLHVALSALFTRPLRIEDELLYLAALPAGRRVSRSRDAAPNPRCDWRGRMLRGEPYDANSAAMGGIAGHAGIFSTAAAAVRFCLELLQHPPNSKGNFAEGGTPSWPWLRADDLAGACGRRFGAKSWGALGETGVSLWCDPQRRLAIALLSNGLFPNPSSRKIQHFRPAFHDGVVAVWDARRIAPQPSVIAPL